MGCRGQRLLRCQMACKEQMQEFPAGALVAMANQTLLYSPHLAKACSAFTWGSVGYLQLCMECLRVLAYTIVGYVLPSWHARCHSFVDESNAGSWPHTKQLQAARRKGQHSEGARSFEALHVGVDPGLWALAQLFRTSWQRFCTVPEAEPGQARAKQGCQRCAQQALATGLVGGAAHAETLCCGLSVSDRGLERVGVCTTSGPAPVMVVHNVLDDAGVHGSWAGGALACVVLLNESSRFGSRMHDQPPEEYLVRMLHCVGDFLEPKGTQVCELGSFRPAMGHSIVDGNVSPAAGLHVDLRHGSWGACVRPKSMHEELAQRQGAQALVPGPLSSSRAAFFVPGLAHAPSFLGQGVHAVEQCTRRRIWAGCHQ
jgi:hypothetical protein